LGEEEKPCKEPGREIPNLDTDAVSRSIVEGMEPSKSPRNKQIIT
jgi:hypothetical protein